MNIQTFKKYYQYSLDNKVIPIRCGLDSDHPFLVPNLELDDEGNDIIYMYCLGCNYKLYPGLELLKNIEFILEEMEVNGED